MKSGLLAGDIIYQIDDVKVGDMIFVIGEIFVFRSSI